MITPKQQAGNLIEDFLYNHTQSGGIGITEKQAINFALITAKKMHYELSDLPRIPYNEKRTDYWKMVIYELEKL